MIDTSWKYPLSNYPAGLPTDYDDSLRKYLPRPVEHMDEGRLYCEAHISDLDLYHRQDSSLDWIQWTWDRLYKQSVDAVSKIIMGRDNYFVVKFIPTVIRDYPDPYMSGIKLRVSYEITVAMTNRVIVPTFVYEDTPMSHRVKEWRCGYCGTPNEIKNRSCDKCGAPRALLIQEM